MIAWSVCVGEVLGRCFRSKALAGESLIPSLLKQLYGEGNSVEMTALDQKASKRKLESASAS